MTLWTQNHFVSYAQNREDALLFRALKNVERGCYVDVGACDPQRDSVTKAFYDRGWRGINIEPVTHWYKMLVAERPDDINLQVLAWNKPDTVPFFEVEDSGLSTTDEQQAKLYEASSSDMIVRTEKTALPLRTILNEHNIQEAHFLKIDAEGSEFEVLSGIDFSRFQPWIIVIESLEPLSDIPSWEKWHHILEEQGYAFRYFDGLNRFYTSPQHPELAVHFEMPLTHVDEIVSSRENRLAHEVVELRRKVFLLEVQKDASTIDCLVERQGESLKPIARGGWYEEEDHGAYKALWSGPTNESWLDFRTPQSDEGYLRFHIVSALKAEQLLSLKVTANGQPLNYTRVQDELGFLHEAKLTGIRRDQTTVRITFRINTTFRPRDLHAESLDRRGLGILMDQAEIRIPV